jgi:hypothetical protein
MRLLRRHILQTVPIGSVVDVTHSVPYMIHACSIHAILVKYNYMILLYILEITHLACADQLSGIKVVGSYRAVLSAKSPSASGQTG